MKNTNIESKSSFSEREKGPELENFLNLFDFSVFQKLLDEEFKNAQADKKAEMVSQSRIDGNAEPYGDYRPKDKSIGINIERIKKLAERSGVDWDLLAKKILIHEQLHAATDRSCPQGKWEINEHVGYGRIRRIKGTPIGSALYMLWNEGVTETWARELLRLYISRIGDRSTKEVDDFFERIAEARKTEAEHPYEDEIDLVEAFIERLHKETMVDKRIVRKAVIHGMIRGEGFTEPEFKELAEDIFPSGFLVDLALAERHNTVRRLIEELRRGGSGSSIASRTWKQLIEGILESMGNVYGR